jgi:hypothetical protein
VIHRDLTIHNTTNLITTLRQMNRSFVQRKLGQSFERSADVNLPFCKV